MRHTATHNTQCCIVFFFFFVSKTVDKLDFFSFILGEILSLSLILDVIYEE